SNLIHGAKVGASNFRISHLFYADDVVIVSDCSPRDMDNIIRALQAFYLASGLKINIHKSNVYGTGASSEEVSDMARVTGCAAGIILFIYLGLPIGSNMNRTANWNKLVDLFRSKLSPWKANLLSIEGRSTLIKSVLGSVAIYYMTRNHIDDIILLSMITSTRGNRCFPRKLQMYDIKFATEVMFLCRACAQIRNGSSGSKSGTLQT
nr:hypothetical protein [Tanacetum cinerariifolium]